MPVGKPSGRRARSRLYLWLTFYLDKDNPQTFLNATQAARQAGYNAKSDDAFRKIGSENITRLHDEIESWFNGGGLSKEHILNRLREGLDATVVRVFCHNGEVIYADPQIDWKTRREYLELIMRKDGMFAAEKREANININVRELHLHREMFERVSDEVMRKIIAEESARDNQLKE